MTRLAYGLLRLLGWRFLGEVPPLPKMILIGAPHTSNWDFIVFIAAMRAYRMTPRFLGKDTLFRWPLRRLLVGLGGIPVDRSQPGGVVARVADEFSRAEEMILVIAPEGTRRASPWWRSGFLNLAIAADVPIVAGAIDYDRKQVTLGQPLRFDGDFTRLMDGLRRFYEDRSGLHPERQGPIRLQEEAS